MARRRSASSRFRCTYSSFGSPVDSGGPGSSSPRSVACDVSRIHRMLTKPMAPAMAMYQLVAGGFDQLVGHRLLRVGEKGGGEVVANREAGVAHICLGAGTAF